MQRRLLRRKLSGPTVKQKPLEHVPNAGFLLYDGDQGQIYFRLFSYARYLNQRNLDPTYVDFFGNTHTVPLRQDMQLLKFFAPFSGWFLTPKFRYYLYVWSANTAQGDPAQVVGAGNLSYNFNRYVNVGAGITSLPSVRSTEGQFPYWLGVDDRLIADEFFRGSYTTGVWLKGELLTKFKYMAMFANNLSTLGVSASQLDNKFDTQSYMLQWLPTTGEFGLWGTFGDYDYHEKVATRVGVHFTHSLEDKQSQPGANGIENTQIRLTDGSIIFTPDLFGPGITVNTVNYKMMSLDAGLKYNGLAFEGGVLPALAERLPGQQYRRPRRHHRQRLPDADLPGWPCPRLCSSISAGRRSSGVRQLLRGARRRELVLHEGAGPAAERRVHAREQESRRIHGVSVSGRRQRQRVSHQPRDEFLSGGGSTS